MELDYKKLVVAAEKTLRHSYSPYSKFRVGAAVFTKSGKIFTGANVENASYGISLCAEKVALSNAVSSGFRDITAIAVVSDKANPCFPCGACRQFIIEFGKDVDVVVKDGHKIIVKKISELLPCGFELNKK